MKKFEISCQRRLRVAVLGSLVSMTALAALAQTSPEQELQARAQAAAQAQAEGDPAKVTAANQKLIAFALAQMARLRSMQGKPAEAADLYRRALEFEDTPDLHYQFAFALMTANEVDAALKETALVLEQDPNNAAAWGLQGKLHMNKKEYRDAATSLAKSLELKGDLENAYVLATAFVNLHEPEKANAVFDQLQQAGMKPGQVHVMAGRVYEEAGMPDDAEREYKLAIQADPRSRGHYFLGLLYLTRNGWEPTPQARKEFAAEVLENPTDFFGNYFLGYLASVDKDYDLSDRYLKVAATAHPDWPEPYLYLGLNAYGREDNRAAENFLRKAIELTGADESRNNYQIRRAYFTLGRVLIQEGQKEEGTKYVERSKQIETKLVVNSRPQALDAKAAASQASGGAAATVGSMTSQQKAQAAEAEKQISSILGRAYNDLGTSEARSRDLNMAVVHFREAERWAPGTPGLMRNLGMAAFLAGNYAESARALQVVTTNDVNDRLAQSMLAMSWYSLKEYEKAAGLFDRIKSESLADPRMTYAWADSLVKTKQPQSAAEVLGKLIAQPLPSEMLIRASQLYTDIGDPANAEKCLQLAHNQDPAATASH
jgi:tetratricopeptide (TPR) repeat protein